MRDEFKYHGLWKYPPIFFLFYSCLKSIFYSLILTRKPLFIKMTEESMHNPTKLIYIWL